QRAERVVYATVESSEAKWTKDHDAIYTDVTLRVSRAYKGNAQPGETIVVRREGGVVDGVGMRVFGAPGFTVGEEVVVFVEKRGNASWVVGMSQGKLHVNVLPDGSRRVSPPDLSGISFLPGQKPTQPLKARALEDLEHEVRSYTPTRGAQ